MEVLVCRGALDGDNRVIADALIEAAGFAHFGTNASAPSGHSENTSARTTAVQSESSRGTAIDGAEECRRRMTMRWFCS